MIKIGEFTTNSGRLRITDPCYDRDTWCAGSVDNCATGVWEAFVDKVEVDSWGNRVSKLTVQLKGVNLAEMEDDLLDIDVGVDSGQAGVFDDELYQTNLKTPIKLTGNREYQRKEYEFRIKEYQETADAAVGTELEDYYKTRLEAGLQTLASFDTEKAETSSEFYEVCCDRTLSDARAGTLEYGAVSSSGFGDGSYSAFAFKDKTGRIVGIEIDFGIEDYEDEEGEDDE